MGERGSAGAGMSDSDLFTLFILAPVAAPVVIAVAASRIDSMAGWLLDRGIIVPAGQTLLPVPGLGGPGLDLTRTLMLGLLIVGCVAASIMMRARRARP